MKTLTRRSVVFLGTGLGFTGLAWALSPKGPTAFSNAIQTDRIMTVWYSPACGCCGEWVSYIEKAGIEVVSEPVDNPTRIAIDAGVPPEMQSCHTARLSGLVIEGHVPLQAIEAAIEQDLYGIAVPAMPQGSPGMEGPSPETYTVYAFDADGIHQPFMQFRGREILSYQSIRSTIIKGVV